jgi:3,4-dihydroxy 2-butanone 4-phosphate synthase/GTP cyclohydrolase II
VTGSIQRVARAVADLVDGKAIVLVGCGSTEPDGYLIVAAENASTSALNFLVRHTSGFICAAVTDDACARIDLPPMAGSRPTTGAEYTVAVDAAGVTTGISAKDRAWTLRQIANPSSTPSGFTRPGHVIPIRAHSDGVLGRRRAAEAVIDLMHAAGLREVGALAALVSVTDPTRIADSTESLAFADTHQLNSISIQDIVNYRRRTEIHVRQTFRTLRNTSCGTVEALGYHSDVTNADYIAYSSGDPSTMSRARVHARFETDFAPHARAVDRRPEPDITDALVDRNCLIVIARRANDADDMDPSDRPDCLSHNRYDERIADIAQILRARDVLEPRLVNPPPGLFEVWSSSSDSASNAVGEAAPPCVSSSSPTRG